ncbi:DUF6297 family protein [Arthrobacter castelli]|uniref:DUF6297 family protein n=1 Tax=Arthrobacter castelli TaxID=271431 RepID=UPI00041D30C3|nr:DUF6297 family protein [Arthrobacter castelli]
MSTEAESPVAFDVRGFTASAARAYNRRNTKFSVLFIDLYNAALAAAIVLALSGSTVYAVREQLVEAAAARQQSPVDEQWAVIPPPVLLAACSAAGLLAVLTFARRLGPVSVGRVESQWWLPLPVARRPLVAAPFTKALVLLAIAASVAYLPLSVLTLLETTVTGHVAGAAVFGILAAAAGLLAAAVQVDTGRRRRTALAVVVLLPAVLLPLAAASGHLWPLVPAMTIAAGAWWHVSPRLSGIPAAELTRGGAVTGHARSAAFLMNTNELVQALGADSGAEPPSASRYTTRLFAARPRSTAGALLQADVVAFLRVPRWWLPPLLWLLPPIAMLLAELTIPTILQLGVLLLAAGGAASSAGTVARQTAAVPGLDKLLPMGKASVACVRMAMPAVTLMVWMVLLTAILALFGIADWRLVLLGAIAGAGLAGSTLRSAYKPVPDWSQPPVDTPFGPVPRTQLSALTSGTDVLVVSMVPLALAVYLGQVTTVLLAIQVAASAAAWIAAMVSLSRRR